MKDQEKLDQARICFEQSLALKPDLVEALYNLGIVLHKQGDYIQGQGNVSASIGPESELCAGTLVISAGTAHDLCQGGGHSNLSPAFQRQFIKAGSLDAFEHAARKTERYGRYCLNN